MESFTNETNILRKDLKAKFTEVFSGGLGICNKMFDKFEQQKGYSSFQKKQKCSLRFIESNQWWIE